MKTRKDEQRLLCQVCRTETTHDVTHTNDRSGRTTFERECPLCGHRETTTYYRSDGRWWIVENGPEYPILEDIDEAEGFVDNMKGETITPKRLAQRVIDIAQRVITKEHLKPLLWSSIGVTINTEPTTTPKRSWNSLKRCSRGKENPGVCYKTTSGSRQLTLLRLV